MIGTVKPYGFLLLLLLTVSSFAQQESVSTEIPEDSVSSELTGKKKIKKYLKEHTDLTKKEVKSLLKANTQLDTTQIKSYSDDEIVKLYSSDRPPFWKRVFTSNKNKINGQVDRAQADAKEDVVISSEGKDFSTNKDQLGKGLTNSLVDREELEKTTKREFNKDLSDKKEVVNNIKKDGNENLGFRKPEEGNSLSEGTSIASSHNTSQGPISRVDTLTYKRSVLKENRMEGALYGEVHEESDGIGTSGKTGEHSDHDLYATYITNLNNHSGTRSFPIDDGYHGSQLEENRQLLEQNILDADSAESRVRNDYDEAASLLHRQEPQLSVGTIKKEALLEAMQVSNGIKLKKKVKNKSDSVQTVVYKNKEFLKIGDYREFVFGFLRNSLSDSIQNAITFSPNVGINVTDRFSAGLGLQLNLAFQPSTELNVGLSPFVRYQPVKFLYAQAEATQYIRNWSASAISMENENDVPDALTIAIGVGGVLNVSKKKGLSFQALYQLVQSDYGFNNSPLITRIGINF